MRRLLVHVAVELLEGEIVLAEIARILGRLEQALRRDRFQHPDGIVAHLGPQVGVEGDEQFARLRVPGPPEVIGELAQTPDLFRKIRNRREGAEVGLRRDGAGEGLLVRRLHLDGEVLGAGRGDRQGPVVGLQVQFVELPPVRLHGHLPCFLAALVALLVRPGQEVAENPVQVILDHRCRLPPAFEQHHALVLAEPVLHPQAEARLIGGDRGQGIGGALQRRVAPRLVVGREDGEVAAGEGLVVGHVQEAVMAVEVGRDEDDVDPVLNAVFQTQAIAGLQDRVRRLVVETVGGDGRVALVRLHLVTLQQRDQIGVASQDQQESQDGVARRRLMLQSPQGIQKDVDPLVVELVPSRDHHDLRGRRDVLAEKTGRGGKQFFPGVEGRRPVLRKIRNVLHVQAVRRDDIGSAAQEILRLHGGDLADRREAVGLPGRYGLHGILRRDVVGGGLPLRRDPLHVGVDVDPGAGHRTSEDRGVGRENRPDLRHPFLQAQEGRSAHPFMDLRHRRKIVGAHHQVVGDLDHLAAGVTEHDRLDIVPAAGNGIDAVVLPDPVEELFLVVLRSGAHEDDPRIARDFPSSAAAGDFLDGGGLPKPGPALLVRLLEIDVRFQVGAEQEVLVPVILCGLAQLACDDRVDAADLVADLPTDFEQIAVTLFCHGSSPCGGFADVPLQGGTSFRMPAGSSLRRSGQAAAFFRFSFQEKSSRMFM
ncbi:MAG: hypothetical protein A4E73_01573 [Syntrophaceae bacterium PtaU1.Bin231]|nr:MAG: hypothetical protein A4E73_01573 [Syntrophaceae bacterium PtaU1.Bin231]